MCCFGNIIFHLVCFRGVRCRPIGPRFFAVSRWLNVGWQVGRTVEVRWSAVGRRRSGSIRNEESVGGLSTRPPWGSSVRLVGQWSVSGQSVGSFGQAVCR